MWWPREHKRLATRLAPLPAGQEGYLRRDTSVRFVAAINNVSAALAVSADEPWVATLMGSTGPENVHTLAESSFLGAQVLRQDLAIASVPLFMLITEVMQPSRPSLALRSRRGVALPPTLRDMPARTVALSTPLFLALPSDVRNAPTDPDSAVAFMAGTLTFARDTSLAIYWESYGFAATDTVDVRLRVVREEDASIARRVGEALGVIADRSDSVTIAWREPDVRRGRVVDVASSVPVLGRAVLVNTQRLTPGQYRLVLEMQRRDGVTTRSEQGFVLRQ